MDHIFRETIAAIGGILFIIIGIVRQRERKRLLRSGKKAEGPVLWSLFIFVGVCLLIFAFGLMIYQLSNHKN